MNIYVANIPYKSTDQDLKELFSEFGEVASAKIIMDKFTQQSRGFGFVEMKNDAQAKEAMQSLNGAEFMGKTLSVNEARPKTERSGNHGGGNRGGYDRKPYRNY